MGEPTYADWKAPKGDADLLIWPDTPGLLTTRIRENAALLRNATVSILGVPLAEARNWTRTFLGHRDESPIIVTGHQVELHHPGVWMKNAVIHHLAEVTGGRAMHLAVDTDSPKHLELRWPVSRTGELPPVRLSVTDDDLAAAEWTGRVAGPSPVHATMLERRFTHDAVAYEFEPALGDLLAALRRASLEEGVLPPMLVSAIHQLDWNLGLRYDALLASPLWDSQGFLLLCCHLIAHAETYARCYNAALAEYRMKEGIANEGRPMPDLRVGNQGIEIPLWIDDLGAGTRARAFIINGGLSIRGERFEPSPTGGFDTAAELQLFLRRHNHRLSPRALTLTTFMRLFVADLFLHGIGGGRYDQVTDRTFQTFFGLTQIPSFAVATGTLYFPWAHGRSRACVPCVKHEGHQLKHALLGEKKQRYLQAIAASPRRSLARKQAYLAMQEELVLERRESPRIVAWQDRLDETLRAASQDALVFDRELFYALQPKDRLATWIDQVRTTIGSK